MPSRRAVLAGSGGGFAALVGGVFGIDRWQPGSSPYDWPMARYDAGGTAHNPEATGPKTEPTVRWTTSIDTELFSPPVRVGSALYVVDDYDLAVIDTDSGAIRFRVPIDIWSPVVGVDTSNYETDSVVVRTEHGYVGCNAGGGVPLFGTALGVRRWRLLDGVADSQASTTPAIDGRFPKSRRWNGELPSSHSPVSVDGTLYVPTSRGLAAVDPNNGKLQWQHRDPVLSRPSRPAIRDGTAVLAGSGTVVAVRIDDRTRLWERSLANSTLRAPTAISSTVVVPHETGVTALGFDGAVRWRRTLGDATQEVRRAASTSDVVVVVHGETLYGLNAHSGQTLWTVGGITAPPTIADGVVYATDDARLVAVDISTGDLLFEYEHSGVLAPVIAGDGRLYGKSATHAIAFEEA